MCDRNNNNNNKINVQADFFRDILQSLPVAVALTDDEGCVKYANEAFLRLTNRETDEIINESLSSMFSLGGSLTGFKSVEPLIQSAGRSQLSDWDNKDPIIRTIGEASGNSNESIQIKLVVNSTHSIVKAQNKYLSEYYCFTLTTTGDKESAKMAEAERENASLITQNSALIEKLNEMRQHNSELSRSNQDLSQYAYVASHDLQEPLRKIRIFSDLLIGNPQLSGKEKFIANKINIAAEGMSLLIRDLLNYSKLLKADDEFERVDLQEIVKAVMIDFEIRIQEKKAIVTYTGLPVIHGVKLQMNQLFYNLLGTALKFTVPGQQPSIEISVQEIDNKKVRQYLTKVNPDSRYIHFKFTDNGIGFEPADADRIFEVFKRLYPREVYEGSGIGLALCRRIVQNHGGYLFATSQPGKGSTFNIIMPTRQPDCIETKKGQNEDSAPL